MTERRQQATRYLLDLIKTYGRRVVVIKITADGPVCIAARTFVTRQLAEFSMPFPIDDLPSIEKRHENNALDKDQLSVIFNLAIIDFKEAYIEDECEGDPNAETFVGQVEDSIFKTYQFLNMTFDHYEEEELVPFIDGTSGRRQKSLSDDSLLSDDAKKAKRQLLEWGHKELLDVNDVNKVFWDFAYRRIAAGRGMKSAMLSMSDDPHVRSAIINSFRNFNPYIQPKTEQLSNAERKEKSVKELTKEHNIEMNKLRHELKKEYHIKINELRHQQNVGGYRKIAKKLFSYFKQPGNSFLDTYDFTKIDDVDRFLKWFVLGKKKVTKSTINYIDSKYADRHDDLVFFFAAVEAHNAKMESVASDNEEQEDTDDTLDSNPDII